VHSVRGGPARMINANTAHRILLVDDDNEMRHASACVLARSGYHVDAAEDGEAGWQAIDANNYDLLITDNEMPRLSGLELVERVRSQRRKLPVILASGTVPLDRHQWLRELEITATLQKPFTIAQLLQTVKEVLSAAGRAGAPRDARAPEALRELT
jgi:two-component system OmpR family response regulator